MKVLIAGGTGFIGSALTNKLVDLGYDVVVIAKENQSINKMAKYYKQDIAATNKLEIIFEKENPDIVINQAGIVYWDEISKDPIKDIMTTVIGTLNLLNNCVKYKVKKLIFASSISVYGCPHNKKCVKEEEVTISADIPIPIYSYALTKNVAEKYIYYYSKKYNLKYAILRYAHVYGYGQREQRDVISIFIESIKRDKCVLIVNGGSQIRDYIYIDDVIDATVMAVNKGNDEVFNIGGGMPISVNELLETLGKVAEKNIKVKNIKSKDKSKGIYMDISKAKSRLKWYPKVSLKEGLMRTWDYFVD